MGFDTLKNFGALCASNMGPAMGQTPPLLTPDCMVACHSRGADLPQIPCIKRSVWKKFSSKTQFGVWLCPCTTCCPITQSWRGFLGTLARWWRMSLGADSLRERHAACVHLVLGQTQRFAAPTNVGRFARRAADLASKGMEFAPWLSFWAPSSIVQSVGNHRKRYTAQV